MTVTGLLNKLQYTGNGVTVSFAFANTVYTADALGVILTDGNGVDIPQVLNVDYTLTLAVDFSTATILMNVAPLGAGGSGPLAEVLTIYRTEPDTQTLDYVEGGPFPAESTEIALDKATLESQTQAEQLLRSIKLPVTETNVADDAFDGLTDHPSDVNQYMQWDDTNKVVSFVNPVSAQDTIDAIADDDYVLISDTDDNGKLKKVAANVFAAGGVPTGKVDWKDQWIPGEYLKDDMVRDGSWTMIANKDTSDKAGPLPVGDPEDNLPVAPTFSTQSNISVVWTGHKYTFIKSGWITQLRVYVPELSPTTKYRFLLIDSTNPSLPVTRIIEEPVLIEKDWTTLALGSTIVVAGAVLTVIIEAINSGASTPTSGGWTNNGVNNNDGPPAQGWNRNQQDTIVRIDKTDLDSVDRSTELAGMIAGTAMRFSDSVNPAIFLEYSVQDAPVDGGTYFSYNVILVNSSGTLVVGNPTDMDAETPIPQATQYVTEDAYFPANNPTWATIEGLKEYDGVPEAGQLDNLFGIDLIFQEGAISPDWDLVAVSSSSGAVGATGSSVPVAQEYVDGVDYVSGTTDTLTLINQPLVEDNTQVYFDGVYQNKSTYVVLGFDVNFDAPIPLGVSEVSIVVGIAAGGASPVDSVQGQTGVVVLDTDDIPDTAANRYTNDTDIGKLAGISAGAEVNPDVVPQAEAEAGTATTERIWTAERVNQAIQALGSGSGIRPDVIVEQQESAGVNGGASVAGEQQRVLNLVTRDTVGTFLSANKIQLPVGTYQFHVSAPCLSGGLNKVYLNPALGAGNAFNTAQGWQVGAGIQCVAESSGVCTVDGIEEVEVRHYIQTAIGVAGLGAAVNFGVEIYARVEFWKIA